MLLQFTVSNFLSIKDAVTLNMIALNPVKEFEDRNVANAGRYRMLKSSVIYGANASGKSNFLKAMGFFRWYTVNSAKETQVDEGIDVVPFKLSADSERKPSSFEASFLLGDIKYRYGFEVDHKSVKTEWLLFSTKIKEYPYLFGMERSSKFIKTLRREKELKTEPEKMHSFYQ